MFVLDILQFYEEPVCQGGMKRIHILNLYVAHGVFETYVHL